MVRFVSLTAFLMFLCAVVPACEKVGVKVGPRHPLEGAWKAVDGTIFIFRPDGTFHGVDMSKKEIWGNWVRLSDTRIGFQTLMHQTNYRPQYAIIRKGDKEHMDYIVSNGTSYISAARTSVEKAEALVGPLVESQVEPVPVRGAAPASTPGAATGTGPEGDDP